MRVARYPILLASSCLRYSSPCAFVVPTKLLRFCPTKTTHYWSWCRPDRDCRISPVSGLLPHSQPINNHHQNHPTPATESDLALSQEQAHRQVPVGAYLNHPSLHARCPRIIPVHALGPMGCPGRPSSSWLCQNPRNRIALGVSSSSTAPQIRSSVVTHTVASKACPS